MSEQKQNEAEQAEVRSEEPELADESLEQVAGGCQWGQSVDTITTFPPTFPDDTYGRV